MPIEIEIASSVVPAPDDEYFTLVFKGNLRNFQGNPLRTKTPFGVAVVCGIGDAFEEADELRAKLESLTRDDIEEPRP